jgi:hypothetical protein
MAKKVEEAKVEEAKVEATAEETAVVQAKKAGANFGKKAISFGKKALPVVGAFAVGVGACLIAGAISKKSSADEDTGTTDESDTYWDNTLEELKSEE